MLHNISFSHALKGKFRSQIVLVGNGLERESGQLSWEALVETVTVSDCIQLTKRQKDDIPFPLLYELLSSHSPCPHLLTKDDLEAEEARLAASMKKLKHASNEILDVLPTLSADHIFTTNYSYCIEKAFYPRLDPAKPNARSNLRFNLNPLHKSGKPVREQYYRLHTGYVGKSENNTTGIWHIHGECAVPGSIVLGHDRYGRLLSRIETICGAQRYGTMNDPYELRAFHSWPELFLYGDIYIIGFGFYECEYDLWWLLRRKQRERFGDGKVFFYERQNDSLKQKLLQAHGVIFPSIQTSTTEYDEYYMTSLKDIRNKIQRVRNGDE